MAVARGAGGDARRTVTRRLSSSERGSGWEKLKLGLATITVPTLKSGQDLNVVFRVYRTTKPAAHTGVEACGVCVCAVWFELVLEGG